MGWPGRYKYYLDNQMPIKYTPLRPESRFPLFNTTNIHMMLPDEPHKDCLITTKHQMKLQGTLFIPFSNEVSFRSSYQHLIKLSIELP